MRIRFCAVAVLASWWLPVAAETMVIPKDLYEFVKSRGCGQVTDSYKRIAIERPPYAYDNSSYVVWCTKDLGTQDPQREYTLLIYVKAPPFSKCPEKIEKWHPIGGLE